MLLKNFLNLFLKDYRPHSRRHGPLGRDKSCKYFFVFYERLYRDIGLYSFYQNTFGLIY